MIRDSSATYGWVSIALHWIVAVIVVALLYTGNSIVFATSSGSIGRYVQLHTSIAVAGYLLLWARILWRWRSGHPAPLVSQRGWSFVVGIGVHYMILVAMAVMLVSGPLMVWSSGGSISAGSFDIPAPIRVDPSVGPVLCHVHAIAGTVILYGVLLHVAGVIKHVVFNRDGTFSRMMAPERRPAEIPQPRRVHRQC